jgi:hypothetical protein
MIAIKTLAKKINRGIKSCGLKKEETTPATKNGARNITREIATLKMITNGCRRKTKTTRSPSSWPWNELCDVLNIDSKDFIPLVEFAINCF